MHIRRLTAALAIVMAMGIGGTAFAASADQDRPDIASLATMKVTLQQAIATAEQQDGGRAVSADVGGKTGATHIVVKVAGPKGVRTVVVDGQSGQVTRTMAAGNEEGGQEQDDND